MLDRDQGRGAGRVDDVVRPHQVEAVGDDAGGDVRDQARKNLGIERRQLCPQAVTQCIEFLVTEVRTDLGHQLEHLVEHAAVEHQVRSAAVGVVAAAEDDAGTFVVERLVEIAGVGQRVARVLQRQEMVRLAPVDGIGHDA